MSTSAARRKSRGELYQRLIMLLIGYFASHYGIVDLPVDEFARLAM